MAEERSLAVGVSYIGFSEPGDGIPGSVFTQFPIIEEGSVILNFSDPTTVEFRAEGMNEPWESFDKAGDADSIDLNIPSPKASEMAFFLGGTVVGDKWQAPSIKPIIRKTFKMQSSPYKGKITEYVFTHCKVVGKLNQAPGAEQTDLLQVRVTKLGAITSTGLVKSPWSREVKDIEDED